MIYKLADGVKLIETEQGAYLQEVMTNEKYVVGGAGINFIKLIDGVRDMDEILEELVKIFGPNVEPYIIAKDLEQFMYQLASNGLVEIVKMDYPQMKA